MATGVFSWTLNRQRADDPRAGIQVQGGGSFGRRFDDCAIQDAALWRPRITGGPVAADKADRGRLEVGPAHERACSLHTDHHTLEYQQVDRAPDGVDAHLVLGRQVRLGADGVTRAPKSRRDIRRDPVAHCTVERALITVTTHAGLSGHCSRRKRITAYRQRATTTRREPLLDSEQMMPLDRSMLTGKSPGSPERPLDKVRA